MFEVCIRLDDQGQYSVGVEPAAEESMDISGEQGGMQGKGMQDAQGGTMDMMKGGMQGEGADNEKDMTPAKNLDDALAQARQLLMSKSGESMTNARNEVAGQVWPGQ